MHACVHVDVVCLYLYVYVYLHADFLEAPRVEACKRKPLKACQKARKLSCKANLQILPLRPKDPQTRKMAAKRPHHSLGIEAPSSKSACLWSAGFNN